MAELNQKAAAVNGRKFRARKVAPRVDLTAMVDLAFLLITFFMLTTSLNKPHSLDVAVPDNSTKQEQNVDERRIVSLLVDEGRAFWYHGDLGRPIKEPQVVSFEGNELRSLLMEMKRAIPPMADGKDMVVMVKPSREARAKDIILVLDELKISQIRRYMLSKISGGEEKLLVRTAF